MTQDIVAASSGVEIESVLLWMGKREIKLNELEGHKGGWCINIVVA
jgi:hypothetical protein